MIGTEIGIYYVIWCHHRSCWPCWRLTVQFLYSPEYDIESKRLIMVACEKQPEWDEVGNGWGWCRGHQHHCWRPISPQLSQRSLTYADTPLFDSCIRSSRLPCSVSYICIIKQINPNVKQFSWAINYICFLCPQFFWDVARLGNLISIVYICHRVGISKFSGLCWVARVILRWVRLLQSTKFLLWSTSDVGPGWLP